MKRRILLGLLLTVAVVGGFAQAAKNETYGMVVFLKGSEFFNWCYAGMVDAAKELGVKTELQGPADWDVSKEAIAIEQLITKKAAGILATAGDAKTMNNAINKAIAAKIPVITFDSDAPDSDRLAFCSTESYAAGYLAGKTMAGWLGGKGHIGLSTMIGPDHLARRVNGFKDAIAKYAPNIKVTIVNDEGDVAKAVTVNQAMLQANPDMNAIFCDSGNSGPGAAAAVRALGLIGKVQIMAFDFGGPVIELLEKGEIKGTVGQSPYLMGYMAMKLAYQARHPWAAPIKSANGFGLLPNFIDTGVTILTKDMVAPFKNPPKF
jgi:ribose transport system substrate-binding protein